MHRRVGEEELWNDEEWDGGDSDDEADEDEPTVACPYCRREMFEDSPQCPHCGQYIVEEDVPPSRKPWWIVVGVLLCLAAIWVWIASMQ